MSPDPHEPIRASAQRTCFLNRPTEKILRTFLEREVSQLPNYREVGQSLGDAPPGYRVNELRTRVGSGLTSFLSARAALTQWVQFNLPWVGLFPSSPRLERGETFAVVARGLGLWWVNACRVVTLFDEDRRFGYACGTLPGHVATGEECFSIEWDEHDGSVWYHVRSFSRPRHPLVRFAIWYLHVVQRRFARESAAALVKAVEVLSTASKKSVPD